MRKVFGIFRVRRDERWIAAVVFLLFVMLNALVISRYFDDLSGIHKRYHWLFIQVFHISGFDPLTYEVLSLWDTPYQIARHPLLAFFMYIPYQLNQLLMELTGINCALFIMAAILLFCAFYSFLFLFRIFREVIQIAYKDAILLTFLTLSFAYILVGNIVPDHFALSMFMLILTLYVGGKKMVQHKLFTKWQTVLFFILTAGISLNNGIKIFIAQMFTNGKRFFRPLNLLLAVIIPAIAIWFFVQWASVKYEEPKLIARKQLLEKRAVREKTKLYKAFKDTTSLKDSAQIAQAFDSIMKDRAYAKYQARMKSATFAHQGEPIAKVKYMMWTDVTTSRTQTIIENLFGESILLHRTNLLGDTLTGRPVIVKYNNIINYICIAFVVGLIIAGVWCGRRNRFMWMAISFFLFDMALHLGLGFGINEIYIMSPHWLFVFTIAIAYLFKALRGRWLNTLRVAVGCLAAYLLIYNVSLIITFLTGNA